MKKKTIFRDTVDRYQFVNTERIPIPKFDDLPIKQVKKVGGRYGLDINLVDRVVWNSCHGLSK